ncbi:RidA family protein [Actibacterium pelagium]|uniref:Enamine deaminase RidA, house cleaning of reactive enamine intermediates, YjgF/YER057c/UK114 family n=1 Tax=Actibacterium pelagium TaxID=2029103 RepID=A0A917ABK5_9RHOB|nr:RidA family protein [Actibacterium pelagium]GGE38807.1 hypothetical protein GCM10011517_03210 [Actibacterium pelagium]
MTPIMRISSGSPYEPRIGYCRAVVADGIVYVSGTTGADPETGEMPKKVADQCRNAMAVIGAALEKAGSSFDQTLRVRYILPDAKDFEACWPVLGKLFKETPPAATMIQAGLIDPAMKIEIELTARVIQD